MSKADLVFMEKNKKAPSAVLKKPTVKKPTAKKPTKKDKK